MKLFDFSVDELSYNWESFVISEARDPNLPLTVSNLRKLQSFVQKKLEQDAQEKLKPKSSVSATPLSVKRRTPMMSPDVSLDGLLNNTPLKRGYSATPLRNASSKRLHSDHSINSGGYSDPSSPPPPPSLSFTPSRNGAMASSPMMATTPYNQRKNAGGVLDTLNGDQVHPRPRQEDPDPTNVQLNVNIDMSKFNFRTMRQKVTDVAETLDEQIETFIRIFQKQYSIGSDEIGNPAIMSQTDIVAVGRIVADNSEQRVNKDSVLLESCRRVGGGMRARLDLGPISSLSLFPGQIIAVKGNNPSGSSFVVKELLEMPKLNLVGTPSKVLKTFCHKDESSIIVASGPYTTKDNLLYEPLNDLINHVNESHPDVLVLLGPFVDMDHKMIQDGDFELVDPETNMPVDGSLDDFFRLVVSPKLTNIANPDLKVILIPSIRDAISNHAAFPQPQFDRKQLGLPRNFKCLSNPCTFSLNEVVLSATTIDPLRDLVGAIYAEMPENKNKFSIAASEIVSQRSLYPLFPPRFWPKSTGDSGEKKGEVTSIDMPYIGLAEFPDALPDIVLVPSMMRPFIEVVDSAIVISPGLLAKGTSGGTFASITIRPPSSDLPDTEETIIHKVWERARVDILKI